LIDCFAVVKRQRRRKAILQHAPLVVLAMAALAAVGEVEAVPIAIDLGPSRVFSGMNPETSKVPFNDLNGTPVVGNASLDFLFANNAFVRLFSATEPEFAALIILQTSGSGFLGFLNGTGYLIDANGNAIPGFGVTGSASGNDASLSIFLFPLLQDLNGTPNNQLHRPLDFYGVHFDFTFPSDPSVVVTGGEFQLAATGAYTPFGIGPRIPADISVPDSSSTLFLFGISLAGLAGIVNQLGRVRR
jgi:hypothetical protein